MMPVSRVPWPPSAPLVLKLLLLLNAERSIKGRSGRSFDPFPMPNPFIKFIAFELNMPTSIEPLLPPKLLLLPKIDDELLLEGWPIDSNENVPMGKLLLLLLLLEMLLLLLVMRRGAGAFD